MTKLFFWFLLGMITAALALWMVVSDAVLKGPIVAVLAVLLYGLPAVGAFWMLYMSVRHERNPFPMILLAMVPYSFMWYYFERVRTGRYLSEGRSSDKADAER